MEYSKDVILGINYVDISKRGQARKNYKKGFIKLIKKHKLIATISIICGILIMLDYALVHNFVVTLQTLS